MVPPPIQITKFDYKPSFNKDIRRLDKRTLKDLKKVLDELKNDSVPPVRQLKKLTDSNTYSIRVGKDYRMSFELDGQKCILRRIGSRQKFYDSY